MSTERLLYYQDSAPSTSAFLYKSFGIPLRMSKYGGVTADSSITIAADTTRGPFGLMATHDLLRFYTQNPRLVASYRKVATVTNNGSIDVDSVITLSGATNWEWMKASRGLSSDTDGAQKGWVDVGTWRTKTLIIQFITFPAEGLNIRVETRDAGQENPSLYLAQTFNTIDDAPQTINIEADVQAIRVGVEAFDTGSVDNGSFTMTLRGDSAR